MKFVFIVLIVYFQLVFTRRISELKCELYSTIPKTVERKYPHLVYLTIGTPSGTVYGNLGTLVSRQFVVTSAYAKVIIPRQTKVYFSPNDEYSVIEKHTHPTLETSAAFLKLNRQVKLDSFHRPACIWHSDIFDEPFASTLKWTDNTFASNSDDWTSNKIESTDLIISRDSDCTALNYLLNSANICLQPKGRNKAQYWPTQGSPIQTEVTTGTLPSNYYILGQYLYYYDTAVHQIIGTKMVAHLDWLDNLLWKGEITNCGNRFIQATPLVSYGVPAIRGEFPWHVGLIKKEKEGVKQYICGGTLLNHNLVVTAAHCVFKNGAVVNPNLLTVTMGSYDLDSFENKMAGVHQIILPSRPNEYDPINYFNDISLLKLKISVEYSDLIQPICIPDESTVFDSNNGVVAGWGKDQYQQMQSILTKATIPIQSEFTCRKDNPAFFDSFLTQNSFCAGYANGTSVCSGDSGSALVQESENVFYIRGIVSLGVSLMNESRCDVSQYVLLTHVAKFHKWIDEQINH